MSFLAAYRGCLLLVPVFLMAACSTSLVEVSELAQRHGIFLDEQISADFLLKGWTLHKGTVGVAGDPLQSFQDCFAVNTLSGRVLQVASPSDLVGYVVIRSERKALAYLGLFTSINTHYLFNDDGLIDVDPDDLSDERVIARYKEPRAKENVNGSFIVQRCVFDSDRRVFLLREDILPNGYITGVQKCFLGSDEQLVYPIYE